MRIAGLCVVGCCWLALDNDRCCADVRYTVTSLASGVNDTDGGRGVNNSGLVAMKLFGQAHYWQNGTSTPIPNLFADSLAINDLGHLTGLRSGRGFIHRNGITTDIGSLEPGATTWGSAINNSDVIVGSTYRSASNTHFRAFKWQNGVMTELPGLGPGGTYPPQDHESFALGVNNLGDVVGEYSPGMSTGYPAILWRNNSIITLPTPSGLFDRGGATAINDAGLIVGYASNGVYRPTAVMWDKGVPKVMGTLPGRNESVARAINSAGVVVGNSWSVVEPGHPWVWSNGLMEDLNSLINAPGWELLEVHDVNDLGQIVGRGRLNGVRHGFILNPVPAPGAWIGLAMAGLVAARRRRLTV